MRSHLHRYELVQRLVVSVAQSIHCRYLEDPYPEYIDLGHHLLPRYWLSEQLFHSTHADMYRYAFTCRVRVSIGLGSISAR
jgi:hypothetical protein